MKSGTALSHLPDEEFYKKTDTQIGKENNVVQSTAYQERKRRGIPSHQEILELYEEFPNMNPLDTDQYKPIKKPKPDGDLF